MLDLLSHSEAEQNDEVHHENWPEDWNIKNGEKGSQQRQDSCPNGFEPEFKFWKAADKWFELLLHFVGPFFQVGREQLLFKGWIKLWREESQEQVKKVDSKSVTYDIPSLTKNDPKYK